MLCLQVAEAVQQILRQAESDVLIEAWASPSEPEGNIEELVAQVYIINACNFLSIVFLVLGLFLLSTLLRYINTISFSKCVARRIHARVLQAVYSLS